MNFSSPRHRSRSAGRKSAANVRISFSTINSTRPKTRVKLGKLYSRKTIFFFQTKFARIVQNMRFDDVGDYNFFFVPFGFFILWISNNTLRYRGTSADRTVRVNIVLATIKKYIENERQKQLVSMATLCQYLVIPIQTIPSECANFNQGPNTGVYTRYFLISL